MTDASTPPDDGDDADANAVDARESAASDEETELEALRREVEEKYDFDDFGPADMAEMTADEWDVAFDPDTWITGDELLDRVESEIKSRIARREIFGVFDRVTEGGEPRLVVYSDEGYAVVYPSGQVRGRGTVLQDVEPTVALCSMDDYDVADPPSNWSLPAPGDVDDGSGEFGNLMMQIVAGAQLVAGVVLIGAWVVLGVETLVAPAIGLLFLLAGVFLFATVANARLSDRFRAAEYRDRLRALQAAEERPEFLPVDPDDDVVDDDRP